MADQMSMFNPADVALKASNGDITADMTVKDFIEKNFGVSVDAPMSQLVEKLRGQAQGATIQGKLGMAKPGMAPGGGMPSGQPQAPPVSGIGDLAARIKRPM